MGRALAFLLAIMLALAAARPALAEPSDIDAAARGVVRVVVIGADEGGITPISHGTGFAVSSTRIVTNAHVVADARNDPTLRLGIVPGDGQDAVYARVIAVDESRDLALIETTGGLRLPALTLAGRLPSDNIEVSAVGYPMNVDLAQGLNIGDIFRSQPPVKSRGFLSGARPSRQFDTVLHTAPIARGNSGGPLLDNCGRVLGVNSFGTDASDADAEFFFAVSNRELVPFLRANGVQPAVSTLPCRSLAEIGAEEREQTQREQALAREALAERTAAQREATAQARLEAVVAIIAEREARMALAFLLLLGACGAGAFAAARRGRAGEERLVLIGGGAAAVLLLAAGLTWLSRPDFAAALGQTQQNPRSGATAETDAPADTAQAGRFVCRLDLSRSRVTNAEAGDIALDWRSDGCVNGRTQYGFADGGWSRVLVPQADPVVTVNRFDPETRRFRSDRYLLDRQALTKVRAGRAGFEAPSCGVPGAAATLGTQQAAVLALLPDRPNERLSYSCSPR